MHTRWLLMSSAALLAAVGVALSFLPQEVIGALGEVARPPIIVLAQLAGAMAMAWALMNWMVRGQRLGGIYNRPLALANFLHFFAGAMVLLPVAASGHAGPIEQALVVPYVLLAVWWGAAMFTSPV
jgi:hypothetical protein